MGKRINTNKRITGKPPVILFYRIYILFIRKLIDVYLFNMADNISYGINFPFIDSYVGRYLDTSSDSDEEIRSNLVHLLMSKRGTRYFLPDFGTRLYEYIFEPLDGPTFSEIEQEIRTAAETYMPGILITNISITDAAKEEPSYGDTYINENGQREFVVPGVGRLEHTARIKIDYTNTNNAFDSSDFIIINV
jgi:phage baseplate assembly protein W